MEYSTYRIDIDADHPDWPGGWAKIAGTSAAKAIELELSPKATQIKEFGEHLLEWSFDQPTTAKGVGAADSRLTASLTAAWMQKLLEPVPLRSTSPAWVGEALADQYPDIDVPMTSN